MAVDADAAQEKPVFEIVPAVVFAVAAAIVDSVGVAAAAAAVAAPIDVAENYLGSFLMLEGMILELDAVLAFAAGDAAGPFVAPADVAVAVFAVPPPRAFVVQRQPGPLVAADVDVPVPPPAMPPSCAGDPPPVTV